MRQTRSQTQFHPLTLHLLALVAILPLKTPWLSPKYWAMLETVPARRLAEMLALVRARAGEKPLPRIS